MEPLDANLSQKHQHDEFLKRLFEASGVDISNCYQCGKCSAGCQVRNNGGMDVPPNVIIRMLQFKMEEQVFASKTIWSCVACSNCTARCPRGIDLPRLIDALRIEVKNRGISEKSNNPIVFHETFMNSITKYGRVYELGLFIGLKLKQSGSMFTDLEIGIPALQSAFRRLPKYPPKVRNAHEIRKIIDNCKRIEGENQ